jgi:NADH-quinone oxidoreductase subunit K
MIPTDHAIILAIGLLALGTLGILVRRNLLMMLMSVEIMLNAAGLVFVAAGSRWHQADGQIMVILIFVMAAAEVSVGLALVLRFRALFNTLQVGGRPPDQDDR